MRFEEVNIMTINQRDNDLNETKCVLEKYSLNGVFLLHLEEI